MVTQHFRAQYGIPSGDVCPERIKIVRPGGMVCGRCDRHQSATGTNTVLVCVIRQNLSRLSDRAIQIGIKRADNQRIPVLAKRFRTVSDKQHRFGMAQFPRGTPPAIQLLLMPGVPQSDINQIGDNMFVSRRIRMMSTKPRLQVAGRGFRRNRNVVAAGAGPKRQDIPVGFDGTANRDNFMVIQKQIDQAVAQRTVDIPRLSDIAFMPRASQPLIVAGRIVIKDYDRHRSAAVPQAIPLINHAVDKIRPRKPEHAAEVLIGTEYPEGNTVQESMRIAARIHAPHPPDSRPMGGSIPMPFLPGFQKTIGLQFIKLQDRIRIYPDHAASFPRAARANLKCRTLSYHRRVTPSKSAIQRSMSRISANSLFTYSAARSSSAA